MVECEGLIQNLAIDTAEDTLALTGDPIDSGTATADTNGEYVCDLTNSGLAQGVDGKLIVEATVDDGEGPETATAHYILTVE